MRLPLFLDVSGRRAVVVGGGRVAARRVGALVEAGADVVVVAPEVDADIERPGVSVVRREFADADLDGAWLVLACTDKSDVNALVALEAERRGIWCSRSDSRDDSRAWMPAQAVVDDVQVAVTAGGDPGRARALRDATEVALQGGTLHARRTRRGAGRVVLVGGGPGDPGLMTLAGYRALLDADVVVVDRLAPTDLVDRLGPDVEVVDVAKVPRGPAASQDDINALLVERASAGQVVVRLKGGDPFVLGRGGEEVDACVAAGVAVDVIPGVTSATAAPTLAGVTLTRRGAAQEFTVASGHVPPGDPRSTVDWDRLARGRGTLVLLMAVANLGPIADTLLAGGRAAETGVVIIENASLPEQRIVRARLDQVADVAQAQQVVPPAVVVIGDVVSGGPPAGPSARP